MKFSTTFLYSAVATAMASSATTCCMAFQPIVGTATSTTTTSLYSTTAAGVQTIDVNVNAPRNYNVIEWGTSNCGVLLDNFQLNEQYGEWGGYSSQAGRVGERALYVPANMRITSANIRQNEFPELAGGISQYFDATNSGGDINLGSHFWLFLKILLEYSNGNQSPYYIWMDSLPRQFHTAITFTDTEMECLPPFVKFLATKDRDNFQLFMEVLGQIPQIPDQTKNNLEVCKWAFNVVMTRARAAFGEAEIIPISDMLNHNSNPNVEVNYDTDGNVHVTYIKDVQPNEPLYKCYGGKTNPSKFLATYGFFDASPPATYCKLMTGKVLTPELVNLGFVYERMVFYVDNGAIAEEVWDVMLYTILEHIDPSAKQQFYNAHLNGDTNLKAQFHNMYRMETCNSLLEHVNTMLGELANCNTRIQSAANQGNNNPNLPMIQQHNDFVRETFLKVKSNLEQIKTRG